MAGALLTGQFEQLLLLFVIVFVHELGHIVVARYFGWQVTSLMILPFGGVAEMQAPSDERAQEEFWIVMAGPLTNVLLVVVTLLLYIIGAFPLPFTKLFCVGNGAIALFNLLPIYPLDGGRVSQILLSLRLPFRRAIRLSLYMSLFFIALLLLLSFSHLTLGVQLWLILPYLVLMIVVELRRVPYRLLAFLLARHTHAGTRLLPTAYIEVRATDTLKHATNGMYRHRYHLFKRTDMARARRSYYTEARVLHAIFAEKRPFETFAKLGQYDFIDTNS